MSPVALRTETSRTAPCLMPSRARNQTCRKSPVVNALHGVFAACASRRTFVPRTCCRTCRAVGPTPDANPSMQRPRLLARRRMHAITRVHATDPETVTRAGGRRRPSRNSLANGAEPGRLRPPRTAPARDRARMESAHHQPLPGGQCRAYPCLPASRTSSSVRNPVRGA